MKQDGLFRGIYEFEDPSGGLLAAKVPFSGTADLYDGTAVVVKPNQRAMFIYNGKITDVLKPGTHRVTTDNLPIITKLANWRFGFTSPLRCEVWFFSGNVHTSRKWGTSAAVLSTFNEIGTIPIKAFGGYNVFCKSPKRMYDNLIGSKNMLDISTVEEFVSGQIVEHLPLALKIVEEISELNRMQDKVSLELEKILKKVLFEYGLCVKDIQIQSILPPKEVMEALESRVSMNLLGDQKKYLLYKAANSLDAIGEGNGGSESMQMMMGLMLGRGIMGVENPEGSVVPKKISKKEKVNNSSGHFCHECGEGIGRGYKFCPSCGVKL